MLKDKLNIGLYSYNKTREVQLYNFTLSQVYPTFVTELSFKVVNKQDTLYVLTSNIVIITYTIFTCI